ncbi:MAG: SDR family NAD(P)-dependent oxidoreductase [Pseudomonadota bacterium]
MSSIVVVTGAAGALGHAVAEHFWTQGATVIAVDLQQQALEQRFGGRERFVCAAADLTDAARTKAALENAIRTAGRPDVLCNIAGGFTMGDAVHATSEQTWRRMIDLNVATVFNASAAVVPHMLEAGAGKIINVAAASAASGKGSMGAYCASKEAVARLTESMAQELRSAGINVNAVAPSILDTPANRADMPGADPAQWVALGDLAAVMAFLASPAARAIHGAVVPVVGLS